MVTIFLLVRLYSWYYHLYQYVTQSYLTEEIYCSLYAFNGFVLKWYIYRLYIETTKDCYICVYIDNLMRMNRIFVLLIWLLDQKALYSSLYFVVFTEIREERKTFQVTFFKFFKFCPILEHSFLLYNCLDSYCKL